jgi:hypothetical protein
VPAVARARLARSVLIVKHRSPYDIPAAAPASYGRTGNSRLCSWGRDRRSPTMRTQCRAHRARRKENEPKCRLPMKAILKVYLIVSGAAILIALAGVILMALFFQKDQNYGELLTEYLAWQITLTLLLVLAFIGQGLLRIKDRLDLRYQRESHSQIDTQSKNHPSS